VAVAADLGKKGFALSLFSMSFVLCISFNSGKRPPALLRKLGYFSSVFLVERG
jgi:hypothetical protein